MNLRKSVVFASLLFASGNVFSGGIALSENDCLDILERWAADPNSVPAHLVNHCRDMITAGGQVDPAGFPVDAAGVPLIEPAAGKASDPANSGDGEKLATGETGGPLSKISDPCTGPQGLESVHCWGPWSDLFTAAGPVLALAIPKEDLPLPPEQRGGPSPVGADGGTVTPDPESNFPLGLCQAGESCGFATTLPGIDNDNPNPEDVTVVRYESNPGPTQFVVDPGGDHETVSNLDMVPVYFTNRLGQENVVSEVTENGIESKVRGLVHRDDNGEVELSAGTWAHGPDEPGLINANTANIGNYVWGNAISQGVLDRMNSGQGVSISYSGAMAGDSNIKAIMTVNLDSQPTWSANYNHAVKGYSFDAGGRVIGVNLSSDKNQFSPNVSSGYVQGVLLNDKGSTAIGNTIDVTLDNIGQVKDVGVLQIKPVTN